MWNRAFHVAKAFSTNIANINPKICIVGSGPAGFYAAQYLSNRLKTAQIDIYEKLPVPFGLVRFGVAPDHYNLKKCINTFTKISENPNVTFVGNVQVGKDVSIQTLREAYHIVLLAYGVEDSRQLNIQGSDLKNVFQAKNFVGWYNGLPDDKDLPVDLSGSTATIFGHGNVAIDIARILLSPLDKLRTTDITEHALETLSTSRIKQVNLIGRRGPLQVSFTTKELRELLHLENCCPVWRERDMSGLEATLSQLVRPQKRLMELLVESFKARRSPEPEEKLLKIIFQRVPKEFTGKDYVKSVVLTITRLEGDDLLNQRAVLTDQEEVLETDLVVNSIGYKSVQIDQEIPFDFERGVVKNKSGMIEPGFYVAGWLAKGPSGVLMHTMQHAFGVASYIIEDIEKKGLVRENKPGFERIEELLRKNNVQVVYWRDWLKIDEFEQSEGKKKNKMREKIVSVEEMLKIAAR